MRFSKTVRWMVLAAVIVAGDGSADAAPDRGDLLRMTRAALEDQLYAAAETHARAYLDLAKRKTQRGRGTLLLAQALYGQDRAGEALELVEKLREEGGVDEDELAYWTARLLYRVGRYGSALEYLEDFSREYRRSPFLLDAERLRVRCYVLSGRLDKALEAYDLLKADYAGTEFLAGHMLDWASAWILAGDPARAEPVLKDLLQAFPASPEQHLARLQLARMALARGEPVEAEVLFRELVDDPSVPAQDRRLAAEELSSLLMGQERWEDALGVTELLKGMDAAKGRKAWYQVQLGLLHIRVGSVTNGLALFNQAVSELDTPADAAEGMLRLGRILLEEGVFNEAGRVLQNYLEAFPEGRGKGQALALKAWVLWEEKKFNEASEAFLRASREAGGAAEAALLKVKAADAGFAAGMFEHALLLYEEAGPDLEDPAVVLQARYQASECLARLARWEEALAGFSGVASSTNAGALAEQAALRVATVYEDEGQLPQAVDAYSAAVTNLSGNSARARALHGRGLLYYRMGRFESALADFEEVFQSYALQEVAEQADYMRGWCHYLLGSGSNALAICRAFLEKHPGSQYAEDVRYWLAEYYYKEGRCEEAEVGFIDVADRFPGGKLAGAALYWAGRSAMQVNEYLRAIEHFNRLSAEYPGSLLMPEARFAQGEALSQLGKFAGAILAFEDLIRSYPSHYLAVSAWGRIGDCRFTLGADLPGRYTEAVEAYQHVLDDLGAHIDHHLQAEYKIGRCWEKAGDPVKAVRHYSAAVYRFFAEIEKGVQPSDLWMTRSAFAAGSVLEAQGLYEQATSLYQRVVDAAIPASGDARERIRQLELKRPVTAPANTAVHTTEQNDD